MIPNSHQFNNRSECMSDSLRDGITSKEKVTICMVIFIYVGILVWSIQNVILSYKIRRKKIYGFLPKINLLFFTAIYSRFVTLLDAQPIVWGQNQFLYQDLNVYNFQQNWSLVSLQLVCVYSSTIWMDLLCYMGVIDHRYFTIRLTLRALSIIIAFGQIIFIVLANLSSTPSLVQHFAISIIFATGFITAISGVLFMVNMDKAMRNENISSVRIFFGNKKGSKADNYRIDMFNDEILV